MKVRELKIKKKIADKHKNTLNVLFFITYILLLPFVLLQYLSDFLDWLCNKVSWLRNDIVYTIFKSIYKKEIIEDMSDNERSENSK